MDNVRHGQRDPATGFMVDPRLKCMECRDWMKIYPTPRTQHKRMGRPYDTVCVCCYDKMDYGAKRFRFGGQSGGADGVVKRKV